MAIPIRGNSGVIAEVNVDREILVAPTQDSSKAGFAALVAEKGIYPNGDRVMKELEASEDCRLRIESDNPDLGQGCEEVDVDYKGSEITVGFNAKLSDLHAAVGLRSLRGLDAALARRRAYAERLRAAIGDAPGAGLRGQRVPDGVRTNFQNLGMRCADGQLAAVQAALDADGVETRRYFWPPMHDLPDHRGRFSLPVTDAVAAAMLCLPLHSRMTPDALARIEAALRRLAPR